MPGIAVRRMGYPALDGLVHFLQGEFSGGVSGCLPPQFALEATGVALAQPPMRGKVAKAKKVNAQVGGEDDAFARMKLQP